MTSVLLATDITYSWSQALTDLTQIAPIAALTGFLLFAIVVDLALPKSRRGDAVGAQQSLHLYAQRCERDQVHHADSAGKEAPN